jgi:DNA-binding transcriptional MocR family regulator
VVAQWIKDGVADQLLASVASEARARQAIAQRYLGDAIEQPSCDTSLHVWLPMSELQAERFANTALRRGVMLTPPGSLLVNGAEVSGVRVCLNTVPRPQLERALRIVRSVLADDIVPSQNSIV